MSLTPDLKDGWARVLEGIGYPKDPLAKLTKLLQMETLLFEQAMRGNPAALNTSNSFDPAEKNAAPLRTLLNFYIGGLEGLLKALEHLSLDQMIESRTELFAQRKKAIDGKI